MLLRISNLTVRAKDKVILDGLSLNIPSGGVHVIMGPNGSGKSTLCSILMGHPDYEVVNGKAVFEGADLLKMKTDERARKGLFLSFQYPREIPGVSLAQVTRAAMNARQKEMTGGRETSSEASKADIKTSTAQNISPKNFISSLKEKISGMGLSEDFLSRPLNEHASGGEKKRLEMVQLDMLAPKLAILDEIDSGLDIDAMKMIAGSINSVMKKHGTTFLIITHYQRLLQHISPDSVHIMVDGKIVKSGKADLVQELERDGYKNYGK